jgi:20S proteasome alpha/beta subunit
VSSLLAVHDKAAGPQLYLVEPSGAVVVVSAVAALLLA